MFTYSLFGAGVSCNDLGLFDDVVSSPLPVKNVLLFSSESFEHNLTEAKQATLLITELDKEKPLVELTKLRS